MSQALPTVGEFGMDKISSLGAGYTSVSHLRNWEPAERSHRLPDLVAVSVIYGNCICQNILVQRVLQLFQL